MSNFLTLIRGRRSQIVASVSQHREKWNYWIVVPCQVELKQQRAHTNKASNREHSDGGRGFLFDIDLSLREMVEHGQCLSHRQRTPPFPKGMSADRCNGDPGW